MPFFTIMLILPPNIFTIPPQSIKSGAKIKSNLILHAIILMRKIALKTISHARLRDDAIHTVLHFN